VQGALPESRNDSNGVRMNTISSEADVASGALKNFNDQNPIVKK